MTASKTMPAPDIRSGRRPLPYHPKYEVYCQLRARDVRRDTAARACGLDDSAENSRRRDLRPAIRDRTAAIRADIAARGDPLDTDIPADIVPDPADFSPQDTYPLWPS